MFFAGKWALSACPDSSSATSPFKIATRKRMRSSLPWTAAPARRSGRPNVSTRPKAAGVRRCSSLREGLTEIALNGEDFVNQPRADQPARNCGGVKRSTAAASRPSRRAMGRFRSSTAWWRDIYSIKLGGTGNVTKSHIAWHTPRKGNRDQPSPIVVGNYLVVADMKWAVTACDGATVPAKRRPCWEQQRLRGRIHGIANRRGGAGLFPSASKAKRWCFSQPDVQG